MSEENNESVNITYTWIRIQGDSRNDKSFKMDNALSIILASKMQ